MVLRYLKNGLLVLVCFVSYIAFSQDSKIDSLLSLVKGDKEDSSKVLHLNSICFEYILQGEYYKGLPFGKQGLELAGEI